MICPSYLQPVLALPVLPSTCPYSLPLAFNLFSLWTSCCLYSLPLAFNLTILPTNQFFSSVVPSTSPCSFLQPVFVRSIWLQPVSLSFNLSLLYPTCLQPVLLCPWPSNYPSCLQPVLTLSLLPSTCSRSVTLSFTLSMFSPSGLQPVLALHVLPSACSSSVSLDFSLVSLCISCLQPCSVLLFSLSSLKISTVFS